MIQWSKSLRIALAAFLLCALTYRAVNVVLVNIALKGGVQPFLTWFLRFNTLRYYGKRSLPILTFAMYLLKPKGSRFLDMFYDNMYYIALMLGVPLLMYGFMSGTVLKKMYEFAWQYAPALEWLATFAYLYPATNNRVHSKPASFNIALCGVFAGGWFYEVFHYHPVKLFVHPSHTLVFHTQIISLIFLGYILYRHGWKPTDNFIITSVFLLGYVTVIFPWFIKIPAYFSGYDFYHRNIVKQTVQWLVRLPAVATLVTIPGGFE